MKREPTGGISAAYAGASNHSENQVFHPTPLRMTMRKNVPTKWTSDAASKTHASNKRKTTNGRRRDIRAYRRVWWRTVCRSGSTNRRRAVGLHRGWSLFWSGSLGNVRCIDGQSVMQTFCGLFWRLLRLDVGINTRDGSRFSVAGNGRACRLFLVCCRLSETKDAVQFAYCLWMGGGRAGRRQSVGSSTVRFGN